MADPAKPMMKSASGGVTHHGEGKIEAINKTEVTLSHGPIASLKWGAMTMGFKLPASEVPPKVAVGDRVSFDFVDNGEGEYHIRTITPLAPEAKMPGSPMGSVMSNDKSKGAPK